MTSLGNTGCQPKSWSTNPYVHQTVLGIEGYSGVPGAFCPNIWILRGTKGCRSMNYGCVVATPGFRPARGPSPWQALIFPALAVMQAVARLGHLGPHSRSQNTCHFITKASGIFFLLLRVCELTHCCDGNALIQGGAAWVEGQAIMH